MRNSIHSHICLPLAGISAAGLILASCSGTRHIPEGEHKLVKNIVKIEGVNDLEVNDISAYIKQQPAAFSLTKNDPTVFNPELVGKSVESIRNHLEYLGYYDSEVTSEISYKKKKASVQYNLFPGKQYIIDSIAFDLPSNGKEFEHDFYASTLNMKIREGKVLSESSLTEESNRFASSMRNLGYYGFDKNDLTYEADTLEGDGTSSLIVKLAPTAPFKKSYIASVQVNKSDDLKFRDKILDGLNLIHPGDLYNETLVNDTYTRMASMKAFNNVGIEVVQTADTLVDCTINLSQSKIHGFKISLEASTNSSYLIGISPQLTYTNKNLFRGGEWLNLNFHGNFQFKVSDNIRANEYGISGLISFPRFLGIPLSQHKGANIPRTEVNASFNHQSRPEYTRSVIASSYGYTGKVGRKMSYQAFPIRLNLVKLLAMSDDFRQTLEKNPFMRDAYRTHLDAGVSGMLYYSTSPELNPKTTYSYARISTDISGNILSLLGAERVFGVPVSQYLRGELSLGHTYRFGYKDNQMLAFRVLAGAGYAYGSSNVLPFDKQFYVGGANSLRGWPARSVGPGNAPMDKTFYLPSQAGDLKLEMNAEYRFGLFWKLNGAVFVDAGNVWTLNSRDDSSMPGMPNTRFSFDSIAANWGYGLRCDLDFIVIRIDHGLRIYDPSLDPGNRWKGPAQWYSEGAFALHFGIGYPF